jgi:hypothetical protein
MESTLPKITVAIFEFFIAGVLVICSIFLLFLSLFPSNMIQVIDTTKRATDSAVSGALIAVISTAVAYGVGVISESLARMVFESLLDKIKTRHFRGLINKGSYIIQGITSPKDAGTTEKDNPALSDASSSLGKMRFYVLMKSATLYTEIDSQIARFRLARVLFLCQLIVLAAAFRHLFRDPGAILFGSCLLLILSMVITFLEIRNRFNRYCRAIERSYELLLQEHQADPTSDTAKGQG